MVTFGITTKSTPEFLKFIGETKKRVKSNNMVDNPFTGDIHYCHPDVYIVTLEPIYPRFYYAGIFGCIITLFFSRGWTWWLIPSLAMCLTSVMWSKYFYFIFLVLGAKKNKHKEKIKLMTSQDTLNTLILRL